MNKIAQAFHAVLLAGLMFAGQAFAADGVVNINTADAASLDSVLLNVGPAKAEAIVEYRRAHGAFKSIEELAMVKGIGLKTVEKNRERITLGGGRTKAAVNPAAAARPAMRR